MCDKDVRKSREKCQEELRRMQERVVRKMCGKYEEELYSVDLLILILFNKDLTISIWRLDVKVKKIHKFITMESRLPAT